MDIQKKRSNADPRELELNDLKETSRSKKYLIYFVTIFSQFTAFRSFTLDGPKSTALVWFYFPDFEFDVGLSYLSYYGLIASLGSFISIFVQKFADKIGRKPVLILTCVVMTVMPLIQILTESIIAYTISSFFLIMAANLNVWMIYINEEAPQGKNATWTTMIQLLGGYGSILFYLIRPYFITNNKTFTITHWKGVLFPSVIMGVILTFIIIFTIKETSAYEFNKTKSFPSLEIKKGNDISFRKGIQIILKKERRKYYSILLLISVLFTIGIGSGNLLEPYLMTQSLVDSDEFSLISIVSLIGLAFFLIVTGKIADKYGRKVLLVCYSIVYPISVIMQFTWGSHISNEPVRIIVMIFLKIFGMSTRAAIWTLLTVISIELVPTEVRGIGNSMLVFSMNATGILSGLISASLLPFLGIQIVGLIAAGFMFAIVPLVIKFIPQSHGLDLKRIE